MKYPLFFIFMFNWLDKFLFPEEKVSTAEENEWEERDVKENKTLFPPQLPNLTIDCSFAGPAKYPSHHNPSGLYFNAQTTSFSNNRS